MEYLFVLRQCQQLCAALLECDQEPATRTAALTSITEAPLPAAPATQRRVQKNMPLTLPIYSEAHRLLGVNLSAVPGISGGVLCVLFSEIGTGTHLREKFRSAEAFGSWLGLCPDNRISGGRIFKAGTRKVCNRIANILRMDAQTLEPVMHFSGRVS